jgi:hypothetical protein
MGTNAFTRLSSDRAGLSDETTKAALLELSGGIEAQEPSLTDRRFPFVRANDENQVLVFLHSSGGT